MTTETIAPSISPEESIDLSNCEREPIHQLGRIQPAGFLIAISSDWVIARVSENAPKFLNKTIETLLGASLQKVIGPEAVHVIRNRLTILRGDDMIERAFGVHLNSSGPLFDIAIHLVGEEVIIEFEPSEDEGAISPGSLIRSMIVRLQATESFDKFTREAARQVRALSGFDRVMIYKFDAEASGKVIAEAAASGMTPFLGLQFPASDIPKQARALYKRNWLRLIADINDPGVAIVPVLNPEGLPLDLSMSTLRAVSPIHLEYLRNMGVQASMSISILCQGKLWGLIACHHLVPRQVSFERRSAAELFAQMFSLLIENRERDEEVEYEREARSLHNQLMSSMASEASVFDNLSDFTERVRELIPCDGIGLWIDEEITLKGITPTREEFLGIVRFLHSSVASQIYSTVQLGKHYRPAQDYVQRCAGVLAIPISRMPRDYLVFFRHEAKQTVTWGGDPTKPVEVGPNGIRLTPRKSFEAWQETVHGKSLPWTDAELRAAESLRVTLLEVILRLSDNAQKDRDRAAQKQELLIAELNHRVRNILSLIRGLVSQGRTGTDTVDDFAAVLGGRVQALARAHDQITKQHWGPGSLALLIQTEAGAFLGERVDRVRITGTDVALKPQAFSTLALVIHELMTNAVKYGALCDHHGVVEIGWDFDSTDRLAIEWREIGGPAVQAPTRRGFGSTIIERSIPHELKGEADVEYRLAGLHARLVIPSEYIAAAAPFLGSGGREATDRSIGSIEGLVLLVEDSIIIALDVEEILLGMGATRVDTAGSSKEALRLIAAEKPTVALLDVNLGNETSFAVADKLKELGVPFVFATGYGAEASFPKEHSTVPVVKKPYSSGAILAALLGVLPAKE
ncbi:MAG: GAF domain-containing protein [Sphingomonas bacterium]|nr:GAF domain-containing protein [Sphingomonas bacterium]